MKLRLTMMMPVVAILAACGGVTPVDVPPTGEMWFGETFDPDTFAISGRTESVSTTDTFAVVASLPRTIEGSDLNLRVSVDGDRVSNSSLGFDGSGDVWGFTYGPTFYAGTWTLELTDVGGNVLAAGEITATD